MRQMFHYRQIDSYVVIPNVFLENPLVENLLSPRFLGNLDDTLKSKKCRRVYGVRDVF